MKEFVFKNNYSEFNGEVKKQISENAIGTKFAPPYLCIFMDQVETEFPETQKHKPLVWFRYIADFFFIGLMVKESSAHFWCLNFYHS